MRRFLMGSCLSAAMMLVAGSASAMDYVFALSWEPAFCAKMSSGSNPKPECASSSLNGSFAASNLILHGLWPQPESNSYCNVPQSIVMNDKPGQWGKMPPVPYQYSSTPQQLTPFMPGIVSYLDRHEWYKHGTCAGKSPDAYFLNAMQMVQTMSTTTTGQFLASNVGNTVSSNQICDALVTDFGQEILNAGKISVNTVTINGQKTAVLSELWIYLTDSVDGKVTMDSNHLADGYGSLRCDNRPLMIAPVQ